MTLTLLKVQLQSLLSRMGRQVVSKRKKFKRFSGAGKKMLLGLLVVYVLASLLFSIGTFFYGLYPAFDVAGLRWLYFALGLMTAFVLCFVLGIFSAYSLLYDARDNELLLALPIKPGQILQARLLALYGMGLGTVLLVLVPLYAVVIIFGGFQLGSLLLLLLCSLLLPFLALALSSLLGYLLALISQRIRRKSLVITLVSLAFLGLYFYGYTKLMNSMGQLASQGQSLAEVFKKGLAPAYHGGLAISQGSLPSLAIFALFCLLPFALALFLLKRSYLKMLTSKRAARRLIYQEKASKTRGQGLALLSKELRRFGASPTWMMNTGLFLIFTLAVPYFLFFNKDLGQVLADIGLGSSLKAQLAALALGFLAASTFISAVSISLEGAGFWQAQTLPLRPFLVLLAKAGLHILVSLPFLLVSGFAVLVLGKPPLMDALLLFALPLSITLLSALLGLRINLRFPKLKWRHETEPVKQSMGSFLSMSLGFVLFLTLGLLYYFVLKNLLALSAFLWLCSGFFLLIAGLLLYWLHKNAQAAFYRLGQL